MTLDKKFTDILPRDQFEFYNTQIITFANIDCLYLKEGGATVPAIYDAHKLCGGILALKVYDTLYFEGGHINLVDAGIPANRKTTMRPLTIQETSARGESDVAKFSGQENFITAERFLLNAGDGAAFIVAKKIIGNENSRIGNVNTHGAHFCRGASNSAGIKPSGITNIGGSTILIATETFENFNAKMIAKYRDAESYEGRGLCRCYIAAGNTLRNDEGLYAYDVLSNPYRLSDELNINDYGNGSFGYVTNPQKALNNYAEVTAISQGGCRLTLADETVNGLAPIIKGAMILVQVIQKSDLNVEDAGKFIKAKILTRGTNYIVTDFPLTVNLENYQVQVISVPQFVNFTLNQNYTATPKFNGKVGGVFAVAVSNTCDLTDGKINVEGKDGAAAYRYNGLEYIGNAQNHNRLPLSEGHGSVFILAKTLTVNENTRVGATYSGLGGETFGGSDSTGKNRGGGYSGDVDSEGYGSTGGGYIGGGSATEKYGLGGSGGYGGSSEGLKLQRDKIVGGYGSNGNASNGYEGGLQGSHIFVVTETLNNFTQSAFSTGGGGGNGAVNGVSGAAGYGGGAANQGSSGGSSGFMFIYEK